MAIIDFSFPTLHKNEWVVRLIKTAPKGDLFPQNIRFEDKDDAYAYYEQVRKLWQNQKQRGN
jgi:hypothetical protein